MTEVSFAGLFAAPRGLLAIDERLEHQSADGIRSGSTLGLGHLVDPVDDVAVKSKRDARVLHHAGSVTQG